MRLCTVPEGVKFPAELTILEVIELGASKLPLADATPPEIPPPVSTLPTVEDTFTVAFVPANVGDTFGRSVRAKVLLSLPPTEPSTVAVAPK